VLFVVLVVACARMERRIGSCVFTNFLDCWHILHARETVGVLFAVPRTSVAWSRATAIWSLLLTFSNHCSHCNCMYGLLCIWAVFSFRLLFSLFRVSRSRSSHRPLHKEDQRLCSH